MTKDEADEKVRVAEADLATALMRYGVMAACCLDMVWKVREARKARADLDKPRLMTPQEREALISEDPYFTPPNTFTRAVIRGIKADRADLRNLIQGA